MFDLSKSLQKAQERVPGGTRRRRSDRGASRLDPSACAILDDLLSGQQKPAMRELLAELRERCSAVGVRPPSRATVYNHLDRAPVGRLRADELPAAVREVLYNLAPDAEVPAHQVAFRAINEGGLRAMTFAAGLPWLALHRARRLRGWRPRSRGLIEAICSTRGI